MRKIRIPTWDLEQPVKGALLAKCPSEAEDPMGSCVDRWVKAVGVASTLCNLLNYSQCIILSSVSSLLHLSSCRGRSWLGWVIEYHQCRLWCGERAEIKHVHSIL